MRRAFLCCMAALLFSLLGGCTIPGQIWWSPDLKHAAYLPHAQADAYLLNSDGAVVQKLGASFGGFAWSADSRTLYFAASVPLAEVPKTSATLDEVWFKSVLPPDEQGDVVEKQKEDPIASVVYRLRDGKSEPLFTLPYSIVTLMALSPDESKLATFSGMEGIPLTLHVFDIPRNMLYPIAGETLPGMCFTPDNELVYLQLSSLDRPYAGQLVKFRFTNEPRENQIKPIADVFGDSFGWVASVAEDVIFTAIPREVPARPIDDAMETGRQPYHFYRYVSSDQKLLQLPIDAGPLFAISPDGTRVLFELFKPHAITIGEEHHLAVMDIDGTNVHKLVPLSIDRYRVPIWPAWRGNDEIVYSAELDPPATKPRGSGASDNVPVDVGIYHLSRDGRMDLKRRLSLKWPVEMKPTYSTRQSIFRVVPHVEPTTQSSSN